MIRLLRRQVPSPRRATAPAALLVLGTSLSTVSVALFAETRAGANAPSDGSPPATVSPAFPYESRFVEVLGSRMHYVEQGDGDPIVLLHGNPSSSYLWRNVIPHLSGKGRVIAPDLIGMGRSDKPPIDYRFADHYRHVERFVETLGLRDITFVVHDWGATLGFEYARRNPARVKGIAFMEGVLPPAFPQPSFEAMGEEMGALFRALKDPERGERMIIRDNLFIEELLPRFVIRSLGEAERAAYAAPYAEDSSRRPMLAWPRELPIAGEPPESVETLNAIGEFMARTELPMLLVHASPGVLVSAESVRWYTRRIENLETAFVGEGLHYIQEDRPGPIGRAVADWYRRID